MSCCPPAPVITKGGSPDQNPYLQESDIRPGETVECFQKRAGDSTGLKNDKTEDIPNKIRNTDIPLLTAPSTSDVVVGLRGKAGIYVDSLFRLTPNSTKAAVTWEIKNSDGSAFTIEGITFAAEALPVSESNPATIGNGARLKGAFLETFHGKAFNVKVTAKDSGGAEIDTRAFTFSPSAATGSNDIVLVHPMPGPDITITSKFGPRKPPKVGASSNHGGVDFNTPGTRVSNVLAAADGTVEFVGWDGSGGGNIIKIKHLNGAGKYLCMTVYMHLSKQLVTTGQKVVAGQQIGVEGNTGHGTGPHLHFELRLPNGTKIDPEPYIKGSVKTAQVTKPDNTAVAASVETRPANKQATLTEANVEAKQNGCAPTPPDPAIPTDPLPAGAPTDPFEKAWFYTMKHEVGPHWTAAYPSDPEVQQGLIETQAQRKKCGYVDKPGFPGGNTKFGIAAGPNGIKVEPLTYEQCKKMGFNNYWQRGPAALATSKPMTAIILFDINYLHGTGNGAKIRASANITSSMSDAESADALSASQRNFMNSIYQSNPGRNGAYIKGWLKRSAEINAYAKSS